MILDENKNKKLQQNHQIFKWIGLIGLWFVFLTVFIMEQKIPLMRIMGINLWVIISLLYFNSFLTFFRPREGMIFTTFFLFFLAIYFSLVIKMSFFLKIHTLSIDLHFVLIALFILHSVLNFNPKQ